MEERINKLEKGLCKLQEVWKRDMGVGSMEEGSEGIGKNKLGKNNVRDEHDEIGGDRNYRRSVISGRYK